MTTSNQLSPQLRERIETLVKSDDVVLFMKGSRSFPQCGFSSAVVGILNTLVPKYTTVNVLADGEIRQGIKDYADWPTIPQLYVKGEFVGGSDIVKQMHESGELARLVGASMVAVSPPQLTITAAAAEVLASALADGEPGDVIHLTIDGTFEHALDVGPADAGALAFTVGALPFQTDRASATRGQGLTIDFVKTAGGEGFKIDNPNRPAQVRQATPKEIKAMLASGELTEWFDVRTPAEQQTATLGAKLLDEPAMAHIEGLPKDTLIAFHCHHGGRSQNAANHFLAKGFKNVINMAGGIDAWSREIDASVPRY
ncbi:MAG: Grx4 family monothiol glutaredoxin [Myxococcales bacterium]|nr:Grx4 family monothiol glutaredoxin [Myxococcales bacterium]